MCLANCLLGCDYSESPIKAYESLQALSAFAEMNKGKEKTEAFLVVRRNWQTGVLTLKAVPKEEYGFWDTVSNFFFGSSTLFNIRLVVERVLEDMKAIPQQKETVEKNHEAIEFLNKRIAKRYPSHSDYCIKNVALSVLGEKPSSTPIEPSRGAGLENGGNYCFFNATLKALWATPSFFEMIQKRKVVLSEFIRDCSSITESTLEGRFLVASLLSDSHKLDLIRFCRAHRLHDHFDDLVFQQIKNYLVQERNLVEKVIDLFTFISYSQAPSLPYSEGPLYSLIEALVNTSPVFGQLLDHRQKDPTEFFMPFIAHLIPEYSIAYKRTAHINRCCDAATDTRVGSEIWDSTCNDQLRNALARCDTRPLEEEIVPVVENRSPCSVVIPSILDAHHRVNENTILTFHIPMDADQESLSLERLFRGFVYTETLERDVIARSGRNRGVPPATFNEFFERCLPDLHQSEGSEPSIPVLSANLIRGITPPFLPIQILRFPDGVHKSFAKVEIPTFLHVSHAESERREPEEYLLHSIVIHSGSSLSHGHYYTYVLDRDCVSGALSWTEHNDTTVKSVNYADIQQDIEENGYLVIYERQAN